MRKEWKHVNGERAPSRWIMVVAALVVQVCLGVLYAWSVFRPALMDTFDWSVQEAGYPYMFSLLFFAIGMIVAGRWQDKVGPRRVVIVGGVMLALGALLSGLVGKTIVAMVFTYGVLGGLGVGFAYVTPIATCVKWFPDKRGTITGLAVFGFGAGTLVFGPVINALLGSVGIATTFYILAAVFLVLVSGVGSLFRVPPVGWVCPNWTPPPVEPGVHVDYTSRMMFRTRQFWTLWVMYFFGAGAGLMIIGQAVPIGVEVAGLDKAVAASGLGIMALLNGLGRLAWGSLSDRIGRLRTVMLMFVVMIIAFVGVLPYASGFGLWIVGMCLVGFSFGGFLAVMPSITADFYGTAYLGANYGFLFTAYGISGVVAPFIIDYLRTSTGGFTTAMYIFAGLAAVGIALALTVRAPRAALVATDRPAAAVGGEGS